MEGDSAFPGSDPARDGTLLFPTMTGWLPSLNSLRAFEVVSRHLNYRKAAEELNVTPGAANQLVSKLEEAIGTPLLERRGRGLVLTPVGRAGHEGLTLPFRQITHTVERMRAMTNANAGRLIVSTTPSFAASWLVPRLEGFKERNPTVDVLIEATPRLVQIGHGVADVAIRFGVKDHGDHVVYRLFDEELCAFCSPSVAQGPPRITRLEDLEHVPLLRWDLSQFSWATNTTKWNDWKHWLTVQGAGHVPPCEGIRFTDYNLAVQAAIAGQGFVIGSTPVLKDLLDARLLINPFSIGAETDIGYDLVTTEMSSSRAEVGTFVNWILDEAKLNSTHDPGMFTVTRA